MMNETHVTKRISILMLCLLCVVSIIVLFTGCKNKNDNNITSSVSDIASSTSQPIDLNEDASAVDLDDSSSNNANNSTSSTSNNPSSSNNNGTTNTTPSVSETVTQNTSSQTTTSQTTTSQDTTSQDTSSVNKPPTVTSDDFNNQSSFIDVTY